MEEFQLHGAAVWYVPGTVAKTVAVNHNLNTGGMLSAISDAHAELQAVTGSRPPEGGWRRFRHIYTPCPHGQNGSAANPQHGCVLLSSDAAVRYIENIQNYGRK